MSVHCVTQRTVCSLVTTVRYAFTFTSLRNIELAFFFGAVDDLIDQVTAKTTKPETLQSANH
jgi:hypothetical protein